MKYKSIRDARQEKDIRLSQVQNYLEMVKAAFESGDKVKEDYWRERTLERLAGAFTGPTGWNDWI